MTIPVKDACEITFLALTTTYYLSHFRKEMIHAWHRARSKLQEASPEKRSFRAIAMIVLMLAPGGCMQSGPTMLYLYHLYSQVSSEQVRA